MHKQMKQLRLKLSLTQKEFAEKIGTSQNVLANWESGRRNPSASALNNICKTFSVNEEWLRTGNGEMFIETPTSLLEALAEKYGFSDREYAFIAEFAKLGEKERSVILDFVMDVAAKCSQQDSKPTTSISSELDIDSEVESYRRALELQKKVADESSVSNGIAEIAELNKAN